MSRPGADAASGPVQAHAGQGGSALGFDVGGQSTKAVLVSATGEVLARASATTGEATTPESLAESLAELRGELLRGRTETVVSIGMGIAGVLDQSGALRGSPHLPLLVGSRLGRVVGARLGGEVAVHNDADCAAVAEGWGGVVDGRDDYLMIAIGTGVGAGLVLGGKLRVGGSGFGCEFGHMLVAYGGRRCGCGNLGCLEAYISETAAHGLVDGADAGLQARVRARRETQCAGYAEAVFGLGGEGDGEAETIASGMVEVLGAAIASAVNVLDLTTIVLGGGVAPAVRDRLCLLRRAAEASLFARSVDDLEIVFAARGPLAGAIGAARLGMPGRG